MGLPARTTLTHADMQHAHALPVLYSSTHAHADMHMATCLDECSDMRALRLRLGLAQARPARVAHLLEDLLPTRSAAHTPCKSQRNQHTHCTNQRASHASARGSSDSSSSSLAPARGCTEPSPPSNLRGLHGQSYSRAAVACLTLGERNAVLDVGDDVGINLLLLHVVQPELAEQQPC